MKNIKLTLWGILALITGLWLASDTLLSLPYQFFALRSSLINYTGLVAIGVMSVAMILAVRPVFFEPYLGGLDKMYRLHKWLGITGLIFAVTHWLWTQAPKWLSGLGWIERPARHGSPAEQTSAVLQFFQSQRELAGGLGEWAFYGAVVLIVLALVKRFPYRLFFRTHRLLAIVYLLLVFHSFVLMNSNYWTRPIAPLMAILMLAGSVAALAILFRTVGHKRRMVGLIDGITYHKDIHVLEVVIQLKGRWAGHQAGQFAFVTFDKEEGPHPFTITSSWSGDGRMFFVIKELGDYTNTLLATLKFGDPVTVEGPYGQFNFASKKTRQIWVGGGIGITPFIARMHSLATLPDGKTIDLFYTTALPDPAAIAKLHKFAREAKVNLHVLVDATDGFLNVERIGQAVPEWASSDIWFCGPARFGQILRRDFIAKGIHAEDFHQELFDMR